MRRIITITLAVLLIALVVMAGCSQPSAPAGETTKTVTTTTTATAAPEVYKWRMVTYGSAGSTWHYYHLQMGEMLNKMTNGRIQVEAYPADELFAQEETIDAVGRGTIDMAVISYPYYSKLDQVFPALDTLPGGPLYTLDHAEMLVYETDYANLATELLGEYGCQWFGASFIKNEEFMSKVPIRTAADYKGLKLRAAGLGALVFQKLGAGCVSMPGSEAYSALQLGTIDALDLGGFKTNWEFGIPEVTKYAIEPCWHLRIGYLGWILNQDLWNSLPPDIQDTLRVAARWEGQMFYTEDLYEDLQYRQKHVDAGIEFIQLPDEEMDKINAMAADVWKEVAAVDARSAAIVGCYQQIARMIGKPMD